MLRAQHAAELSAEREQCRELANAAATMGGERTMDTRVAELEMQVAQLLVELGQQQMVSDELMVLRQQFTEAEARVKQLQQQQSGEQSGQQHE